jgi:hypothetical protein
LFHESASRQVDPALLSSHPHMLLRGSFVSFLRCQAL